MRKLNVFTLFVFLMIGIKVPAQLSGTFLWSNNHLYFTASNVTNYSFPISITAVSEYNDMQRSESIVVGPGGGFHLGPTTPWHWSWHSGDRIYVTYPDGNTVYWECEMTETKPNQPSFKGKVCTGSVGCDCTKFVPITDGEVWEQNYCKECGHKRSEH